MRPSDADDVGEERVLGAVEVLDELADAVLVLEFVRLAGALVGDENILRAGGEEGKLLQPLVKDVVAELVSGKICDRGRSWILVPCVRFCRVA